MASSSRPRAKSRTPSPSPYSAAVTSDTLIAAPPAQHQPSVGVLITRVDNKTDDLRDVLLAYEGLEKLLAKFVLSDSLEIQATRDELSALLRVVNGEFGRCIGTVDDAIDVVREALRT